MSEASGTAEAIAFEVPKWNDGDVTLISSDLVRFKVSYVLLAWERRVPTRFSY